MAEETFRVELDAYEGPLDLLLYLIQKEEVDVHDIPVARILEKYLEVLRNTETLDLDRAGEFLVMASTLMAIKSAMLLPGEEIDTGEAIDPREDLVRQLIEYRAVKDAGEDLRDRRAEAALKFPRGRAPLPELPEEERPEPPGVREATLFDIFAAFHRLLLETDSEQTRHILYDDVPQERHMERVLELVESSAGEVDLGRLLGQRRDRLFVLGTFLAVLELMKEQRLLVVHDGTADAIRVVSRESDAGRTVLEAIASRAVQSAVAGERPAPKRRPPWKKKGDPEAAESPEVTDATVEPEAEAGPPAPESGNPGPTDSTGTA
ncbi:MAG: segregation and condensation protein A [Planctomycetota bacterium]